MQSEARHFLWPTHLSADPGCRLWEFDFSGVEAVLTGWFSEDPSYIRLARLGVHAYLTAHVAGDRRAPDALAYSDADLAAYLAEIKSRFSDDAPTEGERLYNPCKTVVHGRNYLRTAHGLARDLPHLFKSVGAAQRILDLYDRTCPKLAPWQARTLKTADERHMLGGREVVSLRDGTLTQAHPFGYTHWFWGVKAYKPASEAQLRRIAYLRKLGKTAGLPEIVTFHGRPFQVQLGDDAKRAAAFFPQSAAAGILFEVMLALFVPGAPDDIHDAFYGRTPLRAPIHDSLLLEIPVRIEDRVVERVARAMRRPIAQLPIPPAWLDDVPSLGTHLAIGVEAKAAPVGRSWGEMEKIALPAIDAAGETPLVVDPYGVVADAWQWAPAESEFEEEVEDLRRAVVLERALASAGVAAAEIG